MFVASCVCYCIWYRYMVVKIGQRTVIFKFCWFCGQHTWIWCGIVVAAFFSKRQGLFSMYLVLMFTTISSLALNFNLVVITFTFFCPSAIFWENAVVTGAWPSPPPLLVRTCLVFYTHQGYFITPTTRTRVSSRFATSRFHQRS